MGSIVLLFILSIGASLIPRGISQDALFVVSSPNVFRVGVPEKVVVTLVRGGGNHDIPVKVSLSQPGSTDMPFSEDTRPVSEASSSKFVVVVQPGNLVRNEGEYQHMVLKAESLDDNHPFSEETEILVTLQSGYVFVQTDKPIYTPNQNVMIKVMSLDQNMHPSDRELHVEIINPDNISVKRLGRTQADSSGFLSGEYRFHDHPTMGIWTVTAFYGPDLNNNNIDKNFVKTSVTFEVKPYVLPTFSVTVETPQYILHGADSVVSTIKAEYVFGKPVIGRYVFEYGVLQNDGTVEELGQKLGQLNEDGTAVVTLDDLATDFGNPFWFDQFKSLRFYAKASVHESATQFREAGISTSTVFQSSPYRFSTERTVQYFKAGLNLQVKLDLTFANGDIASGVPVVIRAYATDDTGTRMELLGAVEGGNQVNQIPNTDDQGGITVTRDIQANVVSIQIVATTQDEAYNAANQATISFEVSRSEQDDGEFIVIRPQNADDRNLVVTENTDFLIQRVGPPGLAPNTDLYFLCIAGGKIVRSGVKRSMADAGATLSITITSDMAPQVRLIVYYVTANKRVITDSLQLGVEEKCRQNPPLSLKITPEKRPPQLVAYNPHELIKVEITAPNDSSIGLLAVDKAVYLLRDKDRMNTRKMYDRMKSYDTGCGPGGGYDTSQTFKDSGMTVLTNAILEVDVRTSIGCEEAASRKRRSIFPGVVCFVDYASCLADRERLRNLLHSTDFSRFDCVKRAKILQAQCGLTNLQKRRFEACCLEPPVIETETHLVQTSRSGGNNNQIDGVKVRDDFRETWFFDIVPMPANGDKKLHPVTTPSSITDWHLTAISLSPTQGMCIEDDTNVRVFQTFFLQLHLPYSVVRLEQTEILVTIFNYGAIHTEVTIWFHVDEGLCTAENPAQRHVGVDSKRAASVSFIVRPVQIGRFDITVNATSNSGQDSVRKTLLVVPTGVLKRRSRSVTLNPGRVMINDDVTTPAPNESLAQGDSLFNEQMKRQVELIPISLPMDSIPETESCSVKLIGNLLGTIATDPIEGVESLVRQPLGCGEQTMIRLAPTLFVYKYLRAVGEDTGDQEERITEYIKDGVAREITYRQPNGAYAAWTNRAGSTWLTAFVVKIFSQAKEFNALNDEGHVEGSINWLIDENQQAGGEFHENNHVIHQEMIGAVKGDTSRTAFVLISLLESRNLLDGLKNEKINNSISLAIQFLHNQLDAGIDRIYDKAIVTYALAMAKSSRTIELNNDLWATGKEDASGGVYFSYDVSNYEDNNRPYWLQKRPSTIEIETSGYALLAQLALHEYQKAGKIALWLSKQQNYGGGFVSTQDTVVALQALAKYTERPQFSTINMDCTLSTGGNILKRHVIENQNAKLQEEVEASRSIGHDLKIESTGQGVAKANVELRYNTEKSDLDSCPFHLNITAVEILSNANRVERLRISVCTRFTGEGNTHMSILDVGLYSGFKVVKVTEPGIIGLEEVINGSDSISSYEESTRSVIFYLDEVPKDNDLCFTFSAKNDLVVGNVQAAAVHVYDYYDPDQTCTIFYKPGAGSSLLSTLCSENECICSGGSLQFCNPSGRCPTYTANELEETACESHSSYALKIRIQSQHEDAGFRVYNFTLIDQIKRGDEDIPVDGIRQLYVNEGCKCPKVGQRIIPGNFVLVGKESLKYTTEDRVERYRYLYGKSSKLVFWPEKVLPRNEAIRQALNDFVASMDEESACSREG